MDFVIPFRSDSLDHFDQPFLWLYFCYSVILPLAFYSSSFIARQRSIRTYLPPWLGLYLFIYLIPYLSAALLDSSFNPALNLFFSCPHISSLAPHLSNFLINYPLSSNVSFDLFFDFQSNTFFDRLLGPLPNSMFIPFFSIHHYMTE